MRNALALIITVVCPHCEFSGTPLPYADEETIRCESCGQSFDVPAEIIHDAQHALLVALGEAEPVET
jgi:hypothetical protein